MKIIAATALAVSLACPVAAQNCAPREKVVGHLATKYSETRQSMGIAANNTVLEVWASDETGTWTVTITHPNGMTCMMASGNAFEELDEVLPTQGDPT